MVQSNCGRQNSSARLVAEPMRRLGLPGGTHSDVVRCPGAFGHSMEARLPTLFQLATYRCSWVQESCHLPLIISHGCKSWRLGNNACSERKGRDRAFRDLVAPTELPHRARTGATAQLLSAFFDEMSQQICSFAAQSKRMLATLSWPFLRA